MVTGGYSLSSRRTKNSQLKRQKSVETYLSLKLMRVKLVPFNDNLKLKSPSSHHTLACTNFEDISAASDLDEIGVTHILGCGEDWAMSRGRHEYSSRIQCLNNQDALSAYQDH